LNQDSNFLYKELSEKIIGAFYAVYDEMGYGFLEKVYELALVKELELRNIPAENQVTIKINYKNEYLCDYVLDTIVDRKIILELKAAESLANIHTAQLLNYLKATDFKVGLLLNFGPKPEFKRFVFTK